MLCTNCAQNIPTCKIFYLIPGRDASGIHNTETVAQLCNSCVQKVIRHEVEVIVPKNALTFQQLLEMI